MRFGICCGAARFPRMKELGYDYIEAGFNSVVKMTDEEYEEYVKAVKDSGMKVETCNGFFGPDTFIVGPDADISFLPEYVEKGMQRVAPLGCEVVVLGSGKARNIPEGFDRETGEKQFIEVLTVAADIAEKYGIKIAIEPLKAVETNLINTVQECLDTVRRSGRKNVGALADFHHVFMSGETMEAIENAGGLLFHTHLARANNDRQMPVEPEDLEACKIWANALKKCGYNGRMSLEGSFKPDFNITVEKVLPALKLFNDIVNG